MENFLTYVIAAQSNPISIGLKYVVSVKPQSQTTAHIEGAILICK